MPDFIEAFDVAGAFEGEGGLEKSEVVDLGAFGIHGQQLFEAQRRQEILAAIEIMRGQQSRWPRCPPGCT